MCSINRSQRKEWEYVRVEPVLSMTVTSEWYLAVLISIHFLLLALVRWRSNWLIWWAPGIQSTSTHDSSYDAICKWTSYLFLQNILWFCFMNSIYTWQLLGKIYIKTLKHNNLLSGKSIKAAFILYLRTEIKITDFSGLFLNNGLLFLCSTIIHLHHTHIWMNQASSRNETEHTDFEELFFLASSNGRKQSMWH